MNEQVLPTLFLIKIQKQKNIMTSGILLTVHLKGRITGPQKHVDKQIVSVDVSPMGAKQPDFIHKKIRHTDRVSTDCSRKMRISEEIVGEWERSECPYWEKPSNWKTMTKIQKITSHVKRYDEGHGVSFDFMDNN